MSDLIMRVDSKTANNIWQRLVDPSRLRLILVVTSGDQAEVKGFSDYESFVASVWSSVNPTLHKAASGLKDKALRLLRLSDVARHDLMTAAVGIAKEMVETAHKEGQRIGLAIQAKEITEFPVGASGPRTLYLITMWRLPSSEEMSKIIVTDLELLPEFYEDGRPTVEFRTEP
ncbi:MAG: hypothetical protein AB1792_09045 [Candidatus Zixiibacteriota bacterium]